MSTSRLRFAALAVTLFVGVTASGCDSGGEGGGKEPALGQIPVVSGPVNPALPLDGYSLDQKAYLTVQRAAWQAISRCVSRFGITYTAPPPVAGDLPPMSGDNRLRYGLIDLNAAQARGYRSSAGSSPDSGKNSDSGKSSRWDPSPTELLIVRGAGTGQTPPRDSAGAALPTGGCLAEATALTQQGAKDSGNGDLALTLAKDTYERSFRDSRTVAAEESWSSCMKKAGFSFATSRDANNHRWPDPVGAEEKAAAVADVKCKISTNLVGIWWAVETAYQRRALEENAPALKQVKDFNDNQVRNAARILGG